MSRRGPNAPLDSPGSTASLSPPGSSMDVRLVPVAVALWAGTLAGLALAAPLIAGVVIGAAVAAVAGLRSSATVRRTLFVVVACLLVGVAIGAARALPVKHGPIAELAADQAFVRATGEVAGDPEPRDGYVLGQLRLTEVIADGAVHQTDELVVLVANESWASTRPGQSVRVSGRLEPSRKLDRESAVLNAVGGPAYSDESLSPAARFTEPLRAGVRDTAASVTDDEARGLLPAMLVGDESLISEALREAMRNSGLSHLTAVSGMNVTIVLIMVLGSARWLGVRGYALHIVGGAAILGFVALARPEPSVVRAAVMGAIAIGGVVFAGHRRGLRALAVAVIVLLLADPWLAASAGFALSAVATGGILLLTPAWRRAARWLPGPLATAVAVPLAAQAVCLPIIIAIGGTASLASVPANILAAPAVAPITVIGAGVAVTAPLSPSVAAGLAWLALWPARWIAGVAHWCASLPGAVVGWPGGPVGVALAMLTSAGLVVLTPVVLRRRIVTLGVVVTMVASLTVHPPRMPVLGWPPKSWVLLVCDVGQGDALALRVGDGAAVVVDAGPDPTLVRRCLDDMGIERVPVLVLTHFHADHVLGVPGVLAGRDVGRALVSPVAEPAENAALVSSWLDDAGVPVDDAAPGMRQSVGGDVTYEVMWPRRLTASGSQANNASVVLRADVQGVSMLLTGDIEPEAQTAMRAATRGLEVDVLKVPHHGSPNQDRTFLGRIDADVAVISVGENDYGHPSLHLLDALRGDGMEIARTDRRGTFAIVRTDDGGLGVAVK